MRRIVPGCSSLLTSIALVVELQSELDLPWIVWSIASRSDLTEGSVSEVARATDGRDAVAAEVWSVEVRMIEDVEELGPELQREALRDPEIFECREIEPVEARLWWN